MIEIVKLPVEDRRSVDRVLDAAREAELTDIVIMGYDKNGALWTDVNLIDGGDILWLLELTKAKLLHRLTDGEVRA